VQEYLNKPEIIKVIQYSSMVVYGIAEELGMRYTREFDKILNAILRKLALIKFIKQIRYGMFVFPKSQVSSPI